MKDFLIISIQRIWSNFFFQYAIAYPEEFKKMFLSREIKIEEFIYIEGLYEDIISMIIVMWTPAT